MIILQAQHAQRHSLWLLTDYLPPRGGGTAGGSSIYTRNLYDTITASIRRREGGGALIILYKTVYTFKRRRYKACVVLIARRAPPVVMILGYRYHRGAPHAHPHTPSCYQPPRHAKRATLAPPPTPRRGVPVFVAQLSARPCLWRQTNRQKLLQRLYHTPRQRLGCSKHKGGLAF